MNRLLDQLIKRAFRRGRSGEAVWLGVAAAAWLVRRSRQKDGKVVWRGTLDAGQGLVISSFEPGAATSTGPG